MRVDHVSQPIAQPDKRVKKWTPEIGHSYKVELDGVRLKD
jgi:hypothetical protein